MENKPKNPPAFPIIMAAEGMTLMDYFAAKALEGMLSHDQSRGSLDGLVSKSYEIAIGMLKERQKHE